MIEIKLAPSPLISGQDLRRMRPISLEAI